MFSIAAFAFVDHVPHRRGGGIQRRAHVQRKDMVEPLRRRVDKLAAGAWCVQSTACIVHENVHCAHGRGGLLDHGLSGARVRDVSRKSPRFAAGLLYFFGSPLQLVPAAGGQRDVGALAREGERDGAPDSSTAARHDCLFSLVGKHRISSR